MSLPYRIAETSSIRNFMKELSFPLYFSKPAQQHIEEFIVASSQTGYRGKVVDMVDLGYSLCHRTTYGKFLSQGNWNQDYIWRAIRKRAHKRIQQQGNKSGKPVFAIYDDTISEKVKPSSKAMRPIEETAFHYSHLEHKQVWGHQMLTALLSCNGEVLPYFLERYTRGEESKIDKVCRIIDVLPPATGEAYGLCDSWFTCRQVIDAHWKKGYHLIGGLKTNRIIYPQGIGIQIKDFEAYIEKSDVHLVTVNNSSYWVYRYDGALNGIDEATVILCWPEDGFKESRCLRAFLCTNTELDTNTILEYYSQRWPIEVFFRQTKGNFGLNKYQVRSSLAIDRLLALITLAYLYCVCGTGCYQALHYGLQRLRMSSRRSLIHFVYSAAQQLVPLENILVQLNLA